MTKNIFLLLGSNQGEPEKKLAAARLQIEMQLGMILKTSAVYQTKAWGKTDQPDFLNQIVEIAFAETPQQLLKRIFQIEILMGRERKEKWGARIIDIDILFFDDQLISTETLCIPHPEIANRKFTLVPLNEIASSFIHPILKKSVQQLLAECEDGLEVDKIEY